MNTISTYETLVTGARPSFGLSFWAASSDRRPAEQTLESVCAAIGAEPLGTVMSPEQLNGVLWFFLGRSDSPDGWRWRLEYENGFAFGGGAGVGGEEEQAAWRDMGDLVERALNVPSIPRSNTTQGLDLALTSLRWITSPGAGAAVGIIAFGTTAVGVVLTAGTIVLFGAAAGVSRALNEGLEYRIKHWLGVPESKD